MGIQSSSHINENDNFSVTEENAAFDSSIADDQAVCTPQLSTLNLYNYSLGTSSNSNLPFSSLKGFKSGLNLTSHDLNQRMVARLSNSSSENGSTSSGLNRDAIGFNDGSDSSPESLNDKKATGKQRSEIAFHLILSSRKARSHHWKRK